MTTSVRTKTVAARTRSVDAHWRRHVLPGEKEGRCIGKTKSGKGSKAMLLTDAEGTPIGVDIESASPHEVTLIERLLTKSQVRRRCRTRLLYDKAADSEPLRQRLRKRGMKLIAPYRKWKGKPPRRLRTADAQHYANRWKVERTISWLKQCRRLVTRWEFHAHLFEGFWQLVCLSTILKGL